MLDIMQSTWLKKLFLWSLLFGMQFVFTQNSDGADVTHTNFVIILADDLGYGDLGCYGGVEGYVTPEIDKMASEGLRFTDFYAVDCVCTPSRAGLLTGRYPMRMNGNMGVLFPWSKSGLPHEEVTIAEMLKGKGYSTALIGKWHLGHRPGFLPTDQGFERFWGIPYSNDMAQDGSMPLAKNVIFNEGMTLKDYQSYQPHNPKASTKKYNDFRDKVPLMSGTEVIEWPADQTTITQRYTEQAIQFIEDNRQQPFFLYLAHSMPHIPIFASNRFKGTTQRGLYGDVVSELDWSVGQVLKALRKHGLDRHTMVVFTSDNGPWLTMKDHGGSAGPLRDGKGSSYEGGFRVPGIFWWPGTIPTGHTTDTIASAIDFLPTFANIAGADLPANRKFDGIDISNELVGKDTDCSPRELYLYSGRQVIRMGDWKYRHGKTYGGWSGMPKDIDNPRVEQLFNLRNDIGEQKNLISQYPEKTKQLKTHFTQYRESIKKQKRAAMSSIIPARKSKMMTSGLKENSTGHRLVILADMGNEPDEMQQMAHMMIENNEFDLEALIAVTGKYLRPESKNKYKQRIHPELFHELIDCYEKDLPNLKCHAKGWHDPAYLRSIVYAGQKGYGINDVKKGNASPGSKALIKCLLKDDPRALWVVVNAGSNTLAQALLDLEDQVESERFNTLLGKLRVYENGAQDNSGAWICARYPSIHWMRSNYQTYAYGGPGGGEAVMYGKSPNLGPHLWKPHPYTVHGQHKWLAEHVQKDHGHMGACFPDRMWILHNGKPWYEFLEGGGTSPWMGLVNKGLFDINEPAWGGWGGRFSREKKKNYWSRHEDVKVDEKGVAPFYLYGEAEDTWTDPESGQTVRNKHTPVWRFRRAMWNDLQCRMDWCVKPYAEANHHPVAALNGDSSDTILRITAQPGQTLTYDASASADPDGDKLIFSWWIYPEAGTYSGTLSVNGKDSKKATVKIPADAGGKQIHLILEVRDDNKIASLYDYRRIVLDVSASLKK